MKTIKKGLVAAAFLGLSGCSGPSLQQLRDSWLPEENAVLEDLFVDGGKFDSAEVTFSRDGYFVKCDDVHYFDFDYAFFADGDVEKNAELKWGDITYFDDERDGDIDRLYTDGNVVYLDYNREVNGRYRRLLAELEIEHVHELWEYRWK